MKGLRKLFDYLPDTFEGLKPVLLYPFFGLLLIHLLLLLILRLQMHLIQWVVQVKLF